MADEGKETNEEERVRKVLRELGSRAPSKEVQEDIEKLERILNHPVFRHHSQKGRETPATVPTTTKAHTKSSGTSTSSPCVQFLKVELAPHLKTIVKQNQKVVVTELDISECVPEVELSKEEPFRLFVTGPPNIREKWSHRCRIGDCVLGVSAGPTGGNARLLLKNTPEAPLKEQFERFTEEARADGEHIAVALLRTRKTMVLTGEWTQVEIIRLSTEGGGLGFGIVGGASTGVVVKTVLPGSPAHKDNKLRPGDHILHIGSMNTQGFSSQQVATILRQQDKIVEMVVGRPVNYNERPPDNTTCWVMPTRAALCPQTLEAQLAKMQAASTSGTPTTPAEPNTTTPPPNQTTTTVECYTSPPSSSTADGTTVPPAVPSPEKKKNSIPDGAPPDDLPPPPPPEVLRRISKDSVTATRRTSTPHDPQPSTSKAGTPEGEKPPEEPKISLRSLQEMALTVFCRENWEQQPFDTIDVELTRDPALGLGITVAGYVHRKEEIGGVFVKSLVPKSAAAASGRIHVHDLILEVNGSSLEHVSHADSVRALVRSGSRVRLRLIRFPPNSPQALCLRMLHQQETDTQVIDVQSSNPYLVEEWKRRINDDVEIISAVIRPDVADFSDGGLGIALEGTVDVVDGTQLCPHHYIESLREGGPAAKTGLLKAGDELLQVNHFPLYGESHVTVRQALTRAASANAPVTIVVARKIQIVNFFSPRMDSSLPLSYPLLAQGSQRIVKAKSEVAVSAPLDTTALLEQVSRRLRSRSLEPLTGLAVWNCVPLVVHLMKDNKGLGFSIVDYRDPVHRGESVIVVQSLVPGGVAQADGRIVPGDRLLFVNDHDLSNSSLERAVSVLKSAPMGRVRLGIAKPLPVDLNQSTSHTPLFSRSERLLAKRNSPRTRRRDQVEPISQSQETVWIGAEQYRKLHPQGYYCSRSPSAHSERSLDGSDISMSSFSPCSTRSLSPAGSPIHGSWAYDVVYLPTHLERHVKITKGALPLGMVLDADRDKGVNGCVVKSICGKKAIGLDGRVQVGDYIVKVNTENMRNITNSQARAILKRTNLIGQHCNLTYITAADAKLWKERFHRPEPTPPPISRLSPKVFPKFYRSPYLSRRTSTEDPDRLDSSTEALPTNLESPMTTRSEWTTSCASELPSTSRTEEGWRAESTREGAGGSWRDRRESSHHSARLIDGMPIEQFVHQLIEASFADALSDVVLSWALPEWKGRPPIPPSLTSSPHSSVKDSPSCEELPPTPSHSPPRSFSTVREDEELSPPPSPPRSIDHAQESPGHAHESPGHAHSPARTPPESDSRRHSKDNNNHVGDTWNWERTDDSLIRRDSEPTISSPKRTIVKEVLEEIAQEKATSPKEEQPPPVPATRESPPTVAQQPAEQVKEKEESASQAPSEETTASSTMPSTSSESNHLMKSPKSKFWGEVRTVILERPPNKSFGISIVGGRVEVSQKGGLPGTGNTVSGIFIKSVLDNSPAGQSGMIHMGDRVISVNDIDLRDATHEEAVAAIKNAKNPVKFLLQSLHSFNPHQQVKSSSSTSTVGSIRLETGKNEEITVIKEEKKEHLPERAMVPQPSPPRDVPTPSASSITRQDSGSIRSKTSEETMRQDSVKRMDNTKPKVIEARKSPPVTVPPVKEKSVEKTDSRRSSTRSNKSEKKSSLKEEKKREVKMEDRPLIVSDVSSSETKDDEEGADHAMVAARLGIEEDSAGYLQKTPDDHEEESRFLYTKKKLFRKYAAMGGDLLLLPLEQVPEAGLGLSLAGSRDRLRTPTVFVVAVKPACPLCVRIGDELLEVNGRVLLGLNHIAASQKIRDCCESKGYMEVVVLRRANQQVEMPVLNEEPSGGSSEEITVEVPSSEEKEEQENKATCLMAPAGDGPANENTLQSVENVRKKSWTGEKIEAGQETQIQIDKDGKGLGLSIVGGADTVLGTVVIHEVYSDGAAAADGRLRPGDQVLEVNGVSLRGVSHEQAISLLRRTPPKVRLLIYRDANLQMSLLDPTQIYNMFEIELTKRPGRGLGLSIVGRKNEPGVYVSEVVKGGAAEADNRLITGDQILAINGEDVANSMQEDVAAILKTCVGKVRLKVGRWKINEATDRVHKAAEAAYGKGNVPFGVRLSGSGNNNNVVTEKKSAEGANTPRDQPTSKEVPPPAPSVPRPLITHTPPDGETAAATDPNSAGLSPVSEEPSGGEKSLPMEERESDVKMLTELNEDGSDTLLIELKKVADQQLGMGIGKRTRGILVTSLQPGSAAAEKLKVGDRILAVNACPVTDQLSAVTFVKASGERLFLQVARPRSTPTT